MTKITATELARNLRKILDRVKSRGEEFVIVRNNEIIGRILAGMPQMTALEAMADLYRCMPEEAAKDWVRDSRKSRKVLIDKIRNPWDS